MYIRMDGNNNNEKEIKDFKNRIGYFYTYYSNLFNQELMNFLKKDERTQRQIMEDVYSHNSKLECLLREVRDDDIIECEEEESTSTPPN